MSRLGDRTVFGLVLNNAEDHGTVSREKNSPSRWLGDKRTGVARMRQQKERELLYKFQKMYGPADKKLKGFDIPLSHLDLKPKKADLSELANANSVWGV
jgi:hypothetical protein